MDIIEKTARTVRKHNMLRGRETVLVGLSGGPDSVCLLTVLPKLNLNLKLHAIYIDHGLRPEETPAEIEFTRNLCLKTGVPFILQTIDVKAFAIERKMNKQEAARQLRYHIFNNVLYEIKGDRVALGHTLDDEVETFFMRILRGTGLRGLLSIPPVRGDVIRPLIEVERSEIEAFLDKEGIDYVLDSSNLKRDYLRNKVRFSLMPVLCDLNPRIMDTLLRTVEIFRDEERYLEVAVTKAMMKLITRKRENAIELFLIPLLSLDRVILRRLLRRAIEETRGLRGISFVNIEDVIGLIEKGKTGDRLYLPKKIRAIRAHSTLLLTSEPPVRLGSYVLDSEGDAAIKEAAVIITAKIESGPPADLAKTEAVFDADKAGFPLTIRARKEGDFFYPLGFGKRKKLQDFFVDEKIPRDERDGVPIVASGSEIIWVAGLRADERFKADEKTKRFLVLEMKKINI